MTAWTYCCKWKLANLLIHQFLSAKIHFKCASQFSRQENKVQDNWQAFTQVCLMNQKKWMAFQVFSFTVQNISTRLCLIHAYNTITQSYVQHNLINVLKGRKMSTFSLTNPFLDFLFIISAFGVAWLSI